MTVDEFIAVLGVVKKLSELPSHRAMWQALYDVNTEDGVQTTAQNYIDESLLVFAAFKASQE